MHVVGVGALEVVSTAVWTLQRLADLVHAAQVEDELVFSFKDLVAKLADKLQQKKHEIW